MADDTSTQNNPEIPDWVPRRVCDAARMLVANESAPTPAIVAVVQRLVSDLKMKTVWVELNKHQRREHKPTDRLVHPSTMPSPIESWDRMAEAQRGRAAEYRALGDEASALKYESLAAAAQARHQDRPPSPLTDFERHELNLATVFVRSVSLYLSALQTFSRKDLELRIEELRAHGKDDVADAYEHQAKQPENARFMVDRQRTDPRLHAFVEGLALEMKKMFGDRLAGVIAAIAAVAFENENIRRDQIKAILRTRRQPSDN